MSLVRDIMYGLGILKHEGETETKTDDPRGVELEVFRYQDTAGSWHTHVCERGKGKITGWSYGPRTHYDFEGDELGEAYSLTKTGSILLGRRMAIHRAKKELRRRAREARQSPKESKIVKVKV